MESQNIQFKHALRYGLIAGGVMSFYMLLLFIFGLQNNDTLNTLAYIFFIGGIYLSVKHFRDRYNDGYLNFGKAYSTSFVTCLFIGVVVSVFTYIQFKYLSPGLMKEIVLEMEESLLQRGVSDEQIEMQSMLINHFISPGFMSFMVIFSSAFWGALFSLVIASLLKRQVNPMLNN